VLAFSLIELLVVIAVIGMLATVGLPALRGIGEGNAMQASVRQMLDDLARARLTALNSRSRVCVVFLHPMLDVNVLNAYQPFPESYKTLANIFGDQMASYAIISERTVGDQPGRNRPRYVLEWRSLPEGVMVAPWSFLPWQGSLPSWANDLSEEDFPFELRTDLPFPVNDTLSLINHPTTRLSCLVFEPSGRLFFGANRLSPDRVLRLVPGSVLVGRDEEGIPTSVDLPPATRDRDREHEETEIRVSGLTGRAAVEPPVLSL
jgi:prepilin-type N-terminal cleavage/methylation domain-containing protein